MGAATYLPLVAKGGQGAAATARVRLHSVTISGCELRTEKILPMRGNDDSGGIYLLIRR